MLGHSVRVLRTVRGVAPGRLTPSAEVSGDLVAGLHYGHPELHRIVVRNKGRNVDIEMKADTRVEGPAQFVYQGVWVGPPQLPVLPAEVLQLEDEPVRLVNLQADGCPLPLWSP